VGGVRVGGEETTGKRRGRSAGKGCLGCVCRCQRWEGTKLSKGDCFIHTPCDLLARNFAGQLA